MIYLAVAIAIILIITTLYLAKKLKAAEAEKETLISGLAKERGAHETLQDMYERTKAFNGELVDWKNKRLEQDAKRKEAATLPVLKKISKRTARQIKKRKPAKRGKRR